MFAMDLSFTSIVVGGNSRVILIAYYMWAPLLYTRRCSAGGLTVTFEIIVSFLDQLIVEHKSRISQLLFTSLSLRPYMRHLPICARLRTEFSGVLYTASYGNWFL